MNPITKQYQSSRQRTMVLCQPLSDEDYTPQSAEFASPPKWHIGHTTWFFEEMILKPYYPNYKVFSPEFAYIFNSYYNTFGNRLERYNRGLLTRPSVYKVKNYRAHVDEHMVELLQHSSSKNVESLTQLGINHEQQHQELLLTDIKYTLSLNPTYPKLLEESYTMQFNNSSGWLNVQEGIYKIGHQSDDFCFDNELGSHRVFLEPFTISKALVTYGEFIKFIENDGYKNPKYWLDEGWNWVLDNKIEHPLYWKLQNNQWHHYTLSGLKKINPDAILAHVSFFEASAYAAWKGCRLPTEFEWETASGNLDWGIRWEWTNSAYLPYPNFKIAKGAVGEYNGKFMINQMVLRGASAVTAKEHTRKTYRNFFPADTQWQFSGIRLAK